MKATPSATHGVVQARVLQRKRTALRQNEIVESAMVIIAELGARRFTAQLLAERIGITQGAIFRHFDSMDAIVLAVVDRIEELLFAGFPPEAADPIERLGVFFRQRVRTIARIPAISPLMLSDHLAHVGSGASAERLTEFKHRSREFVRATLTEAADKGSLRGVAGVEEGTILVLGAILALGHTGTRVAERPGLERLSERVWATLETTLRGPSEDSRSHAGTPERRYRPR